MFKASNFKLVLFLVFMGLHLRANCQWLPRLGPITPRPLCGSQFMLASHACALLPFVPGSPPSPPPPPPPAALPSPPPTPAGLHERHRHGHGHRHGHRHWGHGHKDTPLEQDCCRWLRDIDSECVCDLLVHLPAFLSRPVHHYTVQVNDACNVTYQCGSRIRI